MEGNRRRALLIVWPPGIAGLVLAAGMAHAVEPAIVRLNDGRPIISQQSFLDAGAEFAAQGANINGPSLIRVPDWISSADRPNPEARYYLYFRVFEWAGGLYAVAGRGAQYKARDPADPFTPPTGFCER